MTNRKMFFTMLWGAVFRRRSRAMMAVIASLVGAATLFCLASVCVAVPQQMNEEMRAYGANLIVTPASATGKSQGIDTATVRNVTALIGAGHSVKSAAYRYESVRINSAPYTIAGVDVKAVRALNRHWNVTGDWPGSGNVMVGRDVADALGVKVGSRVTIGYRAADASASASSSASAKSDSDESTETAESSVQGTQSTQTTQGEQTTQATENGRVSSDIMDNNGTEFRIAGIVDTGGNEDSIIYATTADMAKLAGSKRGADVVEYSVNAMGDELNDIVNNINRSADKNPNSAVKAQTVTRITSSDTRIIAMLQTLFWIVSLVVLVLTLVGVGTTISSIVSQRRNEIGLRKALGADSRAIGVEFYVESGIYGLIGGLLGTAIGYVLARVLCATVFGRALGLDWLLCVGSLLLSRGDRRHRLHSAGPPRHPYRPRHRFEGGIIMDNEHMLLELDHISKIYGDLHAVDDLSLTVPQGQWLAIVGSSGSGKTTLMNMIGCMDTPSKGSVMLEGRRLEDLNARQLADVRKNMIGLVFQKFYLVPHLTAVENVMVAQYYHSVVDEKQAMEALERVGLKERAHHLPGQLSGGEQQRVCIARALINCPKLILADEPTGNLDERNEKIVLDLFRQLHEQGTTIIVVTHDALVASCAQREIMLNHGVLVGEQWNDEDAKRAYEAAGGKPAFTGSAAEGAQNGGVAISFADPTKAAKTGDTDADGTEGERA